MFNVPSPHSLFNGQIGHTNCWYLKNNLRYKKTQLFYKILSVLWKYFIFYIPVTNLNHYIFVSIKYSFKLKLDVVNAMECVLSQRNENLRLKFWRTWKGEVATFEFVVNSTRISSVMRVFVCCGINCSSFKNYCVRYDAISQGQSFRQSGHQARPFETR